MKQIIIKSIEDIEKYKNQIKEIKIWVCNTACGKSYLCDIDDRFYDLDSFRSKNRTIDRDEKSIEKMYQLLKDGKIVLNAAHTYFLEYLDQNNIPFVYMYGKAELEEEYISRMYHRGSGEEFVEKYGHLVSSDYQKRAEDKRGTFKIEMNENEFVSDYVWQVYGKSKKFIYDSDIDASNYKMVFCDLDGTLLNNAHSITDFTLTKLNQIRQKTNFVITTGRSPYNVAQIIKRLHLDETDCYVICSLGSIIMSGGGKKIFEKTLRKDKVEVLLSEFCEEEKQYIYFGTDKRNVYLKELNCIDELFEKYKVYKVVYLPEDKIKNEKVFSKYVKENFNFYNMVDYLEFSDIECSKAKAIDKMLNMFYLTKKNAIAFGDSSNDIEMLCCVELGIAVCNASWDIKNKARFIADSNNDDGVAKALNHIFN